MPYRYRESGLEKFSGRIITKKNGFSYDEDASYRRSRDREDLEYALRSILEIDPKIESVKTTDVIMHPDFDKLEEWMQLAIIRKGGMGKTKNNAFIKLYFNLRLKHGWPSIRIEEDRYDKYYRAQQEAFFDVVIHDKPSLYIGLPYRCGTNDLMRLIKAPKNFEGEEDSLSKRDFLLPEEDAFIRKYIDPYFKNIMNYYIGEKFIDKLLEESIQCFAGESYEDKHQFGQPFVFKNVPEFYEYASGLAKIGEWTINDGDSVKVKFSNIDSDCSVVVSSSFSERYYYDIDVEVHGKKFSAKRVLVSSHYVSGGWN